MKQILNIAFCLLILACTSKNASSELHGEWLLTNVEKVEGERVIYPPLSALPEVNSNLYKSYYNQIGQTRIILKEHGEFETNLFDANSIAKEWVYFEGNKHIQLQFEGGRTNDLEYEVESYSDTKMIWIVDDCCQLTFHKQ